MLRSIPHVGHNPAHSGRHSGAIGRIEQDVLADHSRQIDLIPDDLEGVGIDNNVLVQLVNLAHDVATGRCQAAPARVRPRRSKLTIDHDAIGQRFQSQRHLNRRGWVELGVDDAKFGNGRFQCQASLGAGPAQQFSSVDQQRVRHDNKVNGE